MTVSETVLSSLGINLSDVFGGRSAVNDHPPLQLQSGRGGRGSRHETSSDMNQHIVEEERGTYRCRVCSSYTSKLRTRIEGHVRKCYGKLQRQRLVGKMVGRKNLFSALF